MTNQTRATTGGFEDRFRVTRTDGSDPHAKVALEAYAASIRSENPDVAHDIWDALEHPENYPAQHD